jgi:penicillin-binding protein 2
VNEDKTRSLIFTRRAALLGGAKVLMLSALIGRMYQLQIVDADRYSVLAEENRINIRLLEPLRGRILDRYGVPLAENDQNYSVEIVPEQTEDLERMLVELSRFVPLTQGAREKILQEAKKKRAFVPITVADNLSWHQVASIEVNAPYLPGVSIEVRQRRRYTQGRTAAHIIGYVAAPAESDLTGDPILQLPGFRIGKNGVERQYDEVLRGRHGTKQVEVNAVGRIIRDDLKRNPEVPGEDIALAIDSELQQFVQQRLASELSASAVVMDVQNGEILALGSTPAYDPSMFTRGLKLLEWRQLTGDPLRPLSNKAISDEYAPGSTFKMVVALAALRAGFDPRRTVFCPGVYSVGNTRFHCWKKGGHGRVNMYDALKHSCDVFFYDTSRNVGIDAIAKMSRELGLGQLTGIDMPGEKPGLIPDSDWKRATFGEPWYPGETPSAGIGQGFITTTPLQLAVMTARMASGRAVVPHVRRVTSGDRNGVPVAPLAPPMDIPEAHLEVVREGMRRVTNDPGGTAYRLRITEAGMEMAGKTGTAQVRRITLAERMTGVKKNEDLPWNRRDHALFVCYAPVAAPQYAVSVVVQHGGGGSKVAGPIAHDIILETQRRNPSRVTVGDKVALADEP